MSMGVGRLWATRPMWCWLRLPSWAFFWGTGAVMLWLTWGEGLPGWMLLALEALFVLAVYATVEDRAAREQAERVALMRRPANPGRKVR